MAPRATGSAEKTPAARPSRARRIVADDMSFQTGIPLDLAPLVSQYKGRGRLAVRIERMPRHARLSAGRNNGDSSWSLALDELEDLEFQPPENFDKAQTLAVRIIARDGEGATTVAVLDYVVSPTGVQGAEPGVTGSADALAQLGRLRKELAQTMAALAEREGELAEAGQRSDEAVDAAKEEAESELAAARAQWQAETDEKLSQAEAKAAADQAELQARIEKLEKRGPEDVAQARARWEQETEKALAKAEEARKAIEAKRLADAEAQWKAQSEKVLADTEARWKEKTEKTLTDLKARYERAEADAKANSAAKRTESAAELGRLRDELDAAQKSLSDRYAELVQTHAANEQARKDWAEETRKKLARAEEEWKAAEAKRLADAEAKWKAQSEKAVAEAYDVADGARSEGKEETRRLRGELRATESRLSDRDNELKKAREEHEKALVEARAAAESAQSESREEVRRLRDELKAVEARLSDRDGELKKARDEHEKTLAEARAAAEGAQSDGREEVRRLRDELRAMETRLSNRADELKKARDEHEEGLQEKEREARAALWKAEESWKAGETTRLAAAEARWKEQSEEAIAELKAKLKAAETEAEANAAALRNQGDEALRAARDEAAALRKKLAGLETELEETRAAGEKARQDLERDAKAVLEKTRDEWKDGEAARMAAAEARWREQSASQLDEAVSRYQAAEQALIEIRMRSGAAYDSGDGGDPHEEITRLKTVLSDRENELARMRATVEEWHEEHDPGGAYLQQPAPFRSRSRSEPDDDDDAPRKRGLIRDVVIVVAVVMAVILFYPRIVAMLPYEWQVQIAELTGDADVDYGDAAPADNAKAAPAKPAAVQPTALVTNDVHLRAGPSLTAPVVTTLTRGEQVVTVREKDKWTEVQVPADGAKAEPKRGWVYNTYLKPAAGAGQSKASGDK